MHLGFTLPVDDFSSLLRAGPVSKIAKCLEDPDERISDAAKTFFHELSNKVKTY